MRFFGHFYFAIMITFLTTRETSCFGRPWDGMRRAAGGGERQLGGEAAREKKKICISLGLAKGEGAGRLKRKGGTEREGDLGKRRLQRGKKK